MRGIGLAQFADNLDLVTSTAQDLLRQVFLDSDASTTDAALATWLLPVLLAQDGSTTRLCETIAGQPISLLVLGQRVVTTPPLQIAAELPGRTFIERITSLVAHGEVMMDNLSYIALDGLPADLHRDLEGGTVPIGHLFRRMWVRRTFLTVAPGLFERLWSVVGLPDERASRAYRVDTPTGPCMVIAETYRRGMLMSERLASD